MITTKLELKNNVVLVHNGLCMKRNGINKQKLNK